MKIESKIHCGEVLSCRKTANEIFTETQHDAGSRLKKHAHAAAHLAILIEGSYFERIGDECFLRLPGDKVFYPELLEHENRFGRLRATCLNVETLDGSSPALLSDRSASKSIEEIRDLASRGNFRSLKDAAAWAGYHPVYLARMFRKAYRISFGDFLRTCRMRRSARLIFGSDLALAEIALDSGYYDQSHLTKELAENAGFTPGELRRLADR